MSEKRKYLKITRPDKTVHFGEPSTHSKLTFQNTLKKPEEKLKLEIVEMTEKEVATHPGFDDTYTPVAKGSGDAAELAKLKKDLESQNGTNEELKKQIAELEAKAKTPPTVNAQQAIAMINEATTAEEVDEIVGEDTRVAVTKAAIKKKEELAKL